MANIAVWGDSIGRAVGFSDGLGRYAVIKPNYREMLLQSRTVNILNHSRFGATLPEGLADFLEAAEVDAPAVAIQFGGNDCNYDWAAISETPGLPMARAPHWRRLNRGSSTSPGRCKPAGKPPFW